MSFDRLHHNLLNKLIDARVDIDAYLQLRKAKGYMTVSESQALRDHLFTLCAELRQNAPQLKRNCAPQEFEALRHAGESIAKAAVCLMSGHHDSPQYVTVDTHKLGSCLSTLTQSIHCLRNTTPLTEA